MPKERKLIEGKLFASNSCLLFNDPKVIGILSTDFFVVGPKTASSLFLAVSQMYGSIFKQMWISERKIFEYPLVLYYTLRKPENKKLFSKM